MEIEITDKVKKIKTIKEYTVCISKLESLGTEQTFKFRYVKDYLKEPYIMYEFSAAASKWSKNAQKKLLDGLDLTNEILNGVLLELVDIGAYQNEKIKCLSVDDFSQNEDKEEDD